jgi:hypothetical protein
MNVNQKNMTGFVSYLLEQFTTTTYSLLDSLQEQTDNAPNVTKFNIIQRLHYIIKTIGQLMKTTVVLCGAAFLLCTLGIWTGLTKNGPMNSQANRWAYVWETKGRRSNNVYHGKDQLAAIERWMLDRFPNATSLQLTLYLTKPPKINLWPK